MGISDKVSQFAGQVQDGLRNSSISFFGLMLKVISAFIVGLTFALAGQEMTASGTLAFTFMLVVVFGLIFRLLVKWSVGAVLLFDLFCVCC